MCEALRHEALVSRRTELVWKSAWLNPINISWTSQFWVSFWAVLGTHTVAFIYIWACVPAALPGNGRLEGMGKKHLLEASFLVLNFAASSFGDWLVRGWAVGSRSTWVKLPMEYFMMENIHCSLPQCVGSVAQQLELWLPCLLHLWVAVVAVLGTGSFHTAAATPRECQVCSAACVCVKQRAFHAVLPPWLCECCEGLHVCVCVHVLKRAFALDSFFLLICYCPSWLACFFLSPFCCISQILKWGHQDTLPLNVYCPFQIDSPPPLIHKSPSEELDLLQDSSLNT